jgi:hypothetical protein
LPALFARTPSERILQNDIFDRPGPDVAFAHYHRVRAPRTARITRLSR